MSISKPTTLPRWADNGGLIVVPPSGKQDVGHVPAERPPAQYENWIKNLSYQWLQFVDAYFSLAATATGNSSLVGTQTTIGQLFARQASESSTSAVFIASDPSGPARWIIDHLGFPGGNLADWEEYWRTSSISDWSISNTGAGTTATATAPSSTFKQRSVVINLPGAAGVQDAKYTPSFFLNYIDNSTALELDTEVLVPALIAGTVVDFGLQFSHAGGNDYYAAIRFNVGSNIQYGVIGSATSFSTSSVAISANAVHRLKLEITGSLINGLAAGTFRLRAYVNGTLLGSTTFTSPGADIVRPVIRGQCTISGGNAWTFGRIRYQHNHLLTSDTY